MKTFKQYLDEGSLDVQDLVTNEFHKMGVPHTVEHGGKHSHIVYNIGGQVHRFPFSHGKKGDGAIRQVIQTAARRHVRMAQAGIKPGQR